MKDNELIGRIVGFRVPHLIDPSHHRPGKPTEIPRTVWGRVKSRLHPDLPELFSVAPIHGSMDAAGRFIMKAERFHTVMPEQYEHV